MGEDKYIKITLVRSKIGAIPKQRGTVEALGLRKIRQSVIQRDNPQIRGMIQKIRHLVTVESATGADYAKTHAGKLRGNVSGR